MINFRLSGLKVKKTSPFRPRSTAEQPPGTAGKILDNDALKYYTWFMLKS
jgi:hypothetical protein